MSHPVDELHNTENATSMMDSILFFVVVVLVLGTLGAIFWSAF